MTRVGIGAFKMPRLQSRHEEQGETIRVSAPQTPRAGTLTFEGDHATLRFERRFPHRSRSCGKRSRTRSTSRDGT